MNYRAFKPISVIVLFFFLWTFGGVFEVAYAFKNSDKSQVTSYKSKTPKPEEEFEKEIEDIYQALTDPTAPFNLQTPMLFRNSSGAKASMNCFEMLMKSLSLEIRVIGFSPIHIDSWMESKGSRGCSA